MKPRKGFAYASREMLDAWISSDADALPERVYRLGLKLFTASMVLAVFEKENCLIVREYNSLAEYAPIANDTAREQLALRYHETQRQKRPVSAKEIIEKGGHLIAFESLLLPQKGGGWCIAVIDFQLSLAIPQSSADVDDIDRAILQSLYEGYSGKEIGQRLGMSHRTIEHRVERLKQGFGARSISQLVAISIAARIEGKSMRT